MNFLTVPPNRMSNADLGVDLRFFLEMLWSHAARTGMLVMLLTWGGMAPAEEQAEPAEAHRGPITTPWLGTGRSTRDVLQALEKIPPDSPDLAKARLWRAAILSESGREDEAMDLLLGMFDKPKPEVEKEEEEEPIPVQSEGEDLTWNWPQQTQGADWLSPIRYHAGSTQSEFEGVFSEFASDDYDIAANTAALEKIRLIAWSWSNDKRADLAAKLTAKGLQDSELLLEIPPGAYHRIVVPPSLLRRHPDHLKLHVAWLVKWNPEAAEPGDRDLLERSYTLLRSPSPRMAFIAASHMAALDPAKSIWMMDELAAALTKDGLQDNIKIRMAFEWLAQLSSGMNWRKAQDHATTSAVAEKLGNAMVLVLKSHEHSDKETRTRWMAEAKALFPILVNLRLWPSAVETARIIERFAAKSQKPISEHELRIEDDSELPENLMGLNIDVSTFRADRDDDPEAAAMTDGLRNQLNALTSPALRICLLQRMGQSALAREALDAWQRKSDRDYHPEIIAAWCEMQRSDWMAADAALARAMDRKSFPKESRQGILLKRILLRQRASKPNAPSKLADPSTLEILNKLRAGKHSSSLSNQITEILTRSGLDSAAEEWRKDAEKIEARERAEIEKTQRRQNRRIPSKPDDEDKPEETNNAEPPPKPEPPAPTLEQQRVSLEKQLLSDPGDVLTRGLLAVVHARMGSWEKAQSAMNGLPHATSETVLMIILEENVGPNDESPLNDIAAIHFATSWLKGEMKRADVRFIPSVRKRLLMLLTSPAVRHAIYCVKDHKESPEAKDALVLIAACESLSLEMLTHPAFADQAFRVYRDILEAEGKDDSDLVQKALAVFQDKRNSGAYGSSDMERGLISRPGRDMQQSLQDFLVLRLAKDGRRDDLEKLVFPLIKSREGDSAEAFARSSAGLWNCDAGEFPTVADKHLALCVNKESETFKTILDAWQARGLEVSLDDFMLAHAALATSGPLFNDKQSSGLRYVFARLAAGKKVDDCVRGLMARIVGDNAELRLKHLARAYAGSDGNRGVESMKIRRVRDFGQWLDALYRNPVSWPLFNIARESGLAAQPAWFGPVFQSMCNDADRHPEHVGTLVKCLGMFEDADTLTPLFVDVERTQTFYQISGNLGASHATNRSLDALHACLDAVKPETLGSSLLKLKLDENPEESVEDWLMREETAPAIKRIPEPRRSAVIASFKKLIKGYPVSTAMRPEISRLLKDFGDNEVKSLTEMVREWKFDENRAENQTVRNAGDLGLFIASNVVRDDPENHAVLLLGLDKVEHYRTKSNKDKLQPHLSSLEFLGAAAQSDFLWHHCIDLAEKRHYTKNLLWECHLSKEAPVPGSSEGMVHLITSGRFGANARNFDPLGHKDMKMPQQFSLGWHLTFIKPDERSLAIRRLEESADTFGRRLTLSVLKQDAQDLFKFIISHADDFRTIPHDRHVGVLHVLAASVPAFDSSPWDLPPNILKVLKSYYPQEEMTLRKAYSKGTEWEQPLINKLVQTILKTGATSFSPEMDSNRKPAYFSAIREMNKNPKFADSMRKVVARCGNTFGADLFRATLAGTDAAMLEFARKHKESLPKVKAKYASALLHAMAGEETPSWAKLLQRSPEWQKALKPMIPKLRSMADVQLDTVMRGNPLHAFVNMRDNSDAPIIDFDSLLYFKPEFTERLLKPYFSEATSTTDYGPPRLLSYELVEVIDGPHLCHAIRDWMNRHSFPDDADIPIEGSYMKLWEVKRFPEALVADMELHGLFGDAEHFIPCKICGSGKRWLDVLATNSTVTKNSPENGNPVSKYRNAILDKARSIHPTTFGSAFWLAALDSSPDRTMPEFIGAWSPRFSDLRKDSRIDICSMLRVVWKKMPELEQMPDELSQQLAPLMASEIKRRDGIVERILKHSRETPTLFLDEKTFLNSSFPAILSLSKTNSSQAAKVFVAACSYIKSLHSYSHFTSEKWLRQFSEHMEFPANMVFRHKVCLLEKRGELFQEYDSHMEWADGKIMTAAWRDAGGEAWPVAATQKVLQKLEIAYNNTSTELFPIEFDPWLDGLVPADRREIEQWALEQENSSSRVTRQLYMLARVRKFAAAVRYKPLENDPETEPNKVWTPYLDEIRASSPGASLPVLLGEYFCRHYSDAVTRKWIHTAIEKFVEFKPDVVAISRFSPLLQCFVNLPRDESWMAVDKIICDHLKTEYFGNYSGRIGSELLFEIMPPALWKELTSGCSHDFDGDPDRGWNAMLAILENPETTVRNWMLELQFADGGRIPFIRPKAVVEKAIQEVAAAAHKSEVDEILLAGNVFFINTSDPSPDLMRNFGPYLSREAQLDKHVELLLQSPATKSPWRDRAFALTALAYPETYPKLKSHLLEVADSGDIGKLVMERARRTPLAVVPWATRAAIKLAEGDSSLAISELSRILDSRRETGDLYYGNTEGMDAINSYIAMVLRMYPCALGETTKRNPEACRQWIEFLFGKNRIKIDRTMRAKWHAYGLVLNSMEGGIASSEWWNSLPKVAKDRAHAEPEFMETIYQAVRAFAGERGNRQSIEFRMKLADGLLRVPIIRQLEKSGIANLIVFKTGLLSLDEAMIHALELQSAWPDDKRFLISLAERLMLVRNEAAAISLFSQAADQADSPQLSSGYRLRQAARLIRSGRTQEAKVVLGNISAETLSTADRRLYDSLSTKADPAK